MNSEIFDISPLINEKIAVFPGDIPYRRNIARAFSHGDGYDLSSIHSTLHLGAHADAPSHYCSTGTSIEKQDLSLYYGLCQVISVSCPPHARIYPEDLVSQDILAPRVLFKTDSFLNPYAWRNDFVSLSPKLISFLAAKEVRLVGIDTPSVDPAEDKELQSHQAIFHHGLRILEGLKLHDIIPGLYVLAAFPLNLKGAEASPVRAVLIKTDE